MILYGEWMDLWDGSLLLSAKRHSGADGTGGWQRAGGVMDSRRWLAPLLIEYEQRRHGMYIHRACP